MKLSHAVVVALLLSFSTPGFAQQPQAAPPKNSDNQKGSPPAQKQGEVVKIGVTLVQLDVTVTDSKGRPVTDLKAEDFEVLQNTHPQRITNFSYVVAQSPTVGPEAAPGKAKTSQAEPPAPPPRLKPNQVRRAIALVADDLTLSFNSTVLVRDALKKFVDEQMQPGDLVAIIRTGAGMGALQQFTNDKKRTLETGIFYRVNLPIKKPGAYQLRTAVRDHTSKKLGSANQFIEVPDLKQGKLALSGLIVRAADSSPEQPTGHAPDNREGRVGESDPQAGPAVRRFKPGAVLDYAYVIFGAKPDKATGRPQLLTRLRLYRDGKLVYDGEPRPFDPQSQTNVKQLIAGGSLRLASDLTPGEYALQVIAVDKLAKEKDRLATGWIDFEIVR